MKFLVIYEKSEQGFSAYVPDLPGCTSCGGSREEIERNIIEAIKFHIEGMQEEGLAIPPAVSDSQTLVIV